MGDAAATSVRSVMQTLPEVPKFITDADIDQDILEAMPEPALRDASLMAAYHLAPTGRRGINTVEMSVPGVSGVTPLGQHEERY